MGNSLEHFRTAKETDGVVTGLLSVLPDLFQRTNLHNTPESIALMSSLHPRLGRAWELHRELDLQTHDYTYEPYKKDWTTEIPPLSVMLFSGGLDSFIGWRLLGQPVSVYFAIGHKAQSQELPKVLKIAQDFNGTFHINKQLNLARQEKDNGYIPHRNLMFMALASQYSNNIVTGQILEWAPDKNAGFNKRAGSLLTEANKGRFQGLDGQGIKIHTPFSGLTKTELVREYKKNFDPTELTKYTTSCYSGGEVNCGECSACFSRYVAMKNNGIDEEYAKIPDGKQFKQKLSWRDFNPTQLDMYIRRWWEMRDYIK